MSSQFADGERRKVKRRALMALTTVLFLLLVSGPLGYMWLEDMSFFDALYMTVITVTTMGFREVKEMGLGRKLLTLFIIVVGVSSLFLLISSLI